MVKDFAFDFRLGLGSLGALRCLMCRPGPSLAQNRWIGPSVDNVSSLRCRASKVQALIGSRCRFASTPPAITREIALLLNAAPAASAAAKRKQVAKPFAARCRPRRHTAGSNGPGKWRRYIRVPQQAEDCAERAPPLATPPLHEMSRRDGRHHRGCVNDG